MTGDESTAVTSHRDHQRDLTIVFVDMVDSTPLAERLDPETLRDVVLGYHDICQQAIARYEGFVARRIGDGVLACFGHPVAHEDDARRAILSGLSIIEEIVSLPRLASLPPDLEVQVRVGVHTGPVVLTRIGDTLELVGSTVNEAARLEAEARAGEVVISEAIRQLVEPHFVLESRGVVELKGVSRGMAVHAVRGRRDAPEPRPAVTALVDRKDERDALLTMWERTRDGLPRARHDSTVLLVAEPGIGKTRLARFVTDTATDQGGRHLVAGTRPFDVDVPFHPIAPMLSRAMSLDERAPAEARYAAVRRALDRDGADVEALAPHLAQVLDLGQDLLDDEERHEPSLVRRRIIDSIVAWWRALAARRPLVLLLDDLHWADPSTLDVVTALVDSSPVPGLLTLITARPEFEPRWMDRVSTMRIARFGRDETEEMCRLLAGDRTLTDEGLDAVLAGSGGVPLFVEGIVSSAQHGEPWEDRVPSDVRSLLDSMIYTPGVDPQFLSLLATIGPEFDVPFVADVAGYERSTVGRQCELLHRHGILDRVPVASPETFTFHHALIRAQAYDRQLASDRRAAHALVADTLARGGSTLRLDPTTTARHFDLGDRPLEAIEHYLHAVEVDQAKGAHTEARRLLERVLELLAHLRPGEQRDRIELTAQIRLALSLTSTESYGSTRALRTLQRARVLAAELGDVPRHIEVLGDIFSYHSVRGERLTSIDIVEEMRELAAPLGGRSMLDVVLLDGLLQFALGHFERSRRSYSSAIEQLEAKGVAEPDRVRTTSPTDGLASSYAMSIPLAMLLGDSAGVSRNIELGLERAHAVGGGRGAFSEGFVRSWITFERNVVGEFGAAAAAAEEMVERAERAGLPMWVGIGSAHRAIAQGHLDPDPSQDSILEMVIDAMSSMGVEAIAPYYITHRGLIRARLGDVSDGLALLDRATEVAERIGEYHYQAETLRHRARLRIEHGTSDHAAAIDDLVAALRLACEQDAPLYAARSVLDLVEVAEVQPDEDLLELAAGCVSQARSDTTDDDLRRAALLTNATPGP
jgi:class 3 adenylate cyclase